MFYNISNSVIDCIVLFLLLLSLELSNAMAGFSTRDNASM